MSRELPPRRDGHLGALPSEPRSSRTKPSESVTIGPEADGLRLDRWLRERYPKAPHGLLQRLLRTGQVRVDGGRARGHARLSAGQRIRIPPVGLEAQAPRRDKVAPADAAMLAARVLHRDADLLAIDKPAGLAVQGGPGVRRHLDLMLDALRFGFPERPRLVHRLDRDTTGVLLLARTRRAAQHCARAFRGGEVEKTYWALVRGRPRPSYGTVDLALAKAGAGGDRRAVAAPGGRSARTAYRTLAAAKGSAWVEFRPSTGRTHQIRAHAAALGCPIFGDARYGDTGDGNEGPLQLHAREIALTAIDGLTVRIVAPLPETMRVAFRELGLRLPGGKAGK